MSGLSRCPRARPWRAPDEPGHVECLRCGRPVVRAGALWVHQGEENAPNRPLPADIAMFNTALELGNKAVEDLAPEATDVDKVFAIVDLLYWRGAFRERWKRPDRRGRAA